MKIPDYFKYSKNKYNLYITSFRGGGPDAYYTQDLYYKTPGEVIKEAEEQLNGPFGCQVKTIWITTPKGEEFRSLKAFKNSLK